jgi:hypothetical protein
VCDVASSVDVLLQGSGELFNADDAAVLNGANTALLGNEVIQFKTALFISPGLYRLSGLLRGRLGTEHAVAGHITGERFVLLSDALVDMVMGSGDAGRSITFSAVTYGLAEEDGTGATIAYQAIALKPYAPVHVQGLRDASGNLTVSWVRRARVDAGWRDNVDVPLDEPNECYDVEAWYMGALARAWQVNSATIIYNASEQMADMGIVPAVLTIKIWQVSARVGRGYGLEGDL